MPAPIHRRRLLGGLGVLALGLAAGCGTTPSGAPAARRTTAGQDADGDLAAAALDQARRLADLLAATVAAHPGLRGRLRVLRDAHDAHAETFEGAVADTPSATEDPDDGTEVTVPGRSPVALADALEQEAAAVVTYAGQAAEAESGRLARLLAAAAAGLSAGVRALDPEVGPELPDVPLDGTGASPAAVEALQLVLAAEHAATWTLAVVGARVSASEDPGASELLDTAYRTHRGRRDAVTTALRGAGEEPVAAAPSYESPVLGSGVGGRLRAARVVEERCAEAYAYLVASTVDDARAWATVRLVDSARLRVDLGGDPQPLPGT